MKPQKAVLLIGSPKGVNSASMALGQRLLAALASRGLASETQLIRRALDAEEKAAAMLAAVDTADIVIFAFPLYVDHLPAPVIWALDRIEKMRTESSPASQPWLAALVQSGFGESHQNEPAVEIMHLFADRTGFRWAGGLAMGMGGAVLGRKPSEREGMLRHVFRGIDLVAAALAEDRPIPNEAVTLLSRKLMSHRLYTIMANFGWRMQARKNAKTTGTKIDLYARPYAK